MKTWAARVSIFVIALLGVIFLNSTSTRVSAAEEVVPRPELEQTTTLLYLPSITRSSSQTQEEPLLNGDFEEGLVSWQEYSLWGWPSIMPKEYLPVQPHSGDWAVWLGGAYDEINGIWQAVNVPSDNPILSFYYWIASEDACGYDLAVVAVNLEVVADSFWLCAAANTSGWVLRQVDLSEFAGEHIELDIVVGTDSVLNSNLFIDDVSFTKSAVEPLATTGESEGGDSLLSGLKPEADGPSKLETDRTGRANILSGLLQESR